eukprot:3728976-Amphidinium_carterae.1
MRDYLERALRILESHYGEEHSSVAVVLTNLGNACGTLGDAHKKHDHLVRALRIKESSFGRQHPEVAITLHNLAAASSQLGDLSSAHEQVERALRIFRAGSLGAEHPNALKAKRLLADIEGKMRLQEDEKERLGRERLKLEETLAYEERSLGPRHPDVGTTLTKLADLH